MISVVIPTYNRGHVIRKSIESVLNQSFDDIEVIVVDDGSTDDTKLVVHNINDDRVRYIYQHNAGACAARNTGIDCAGGDYIAFQDSDDIWHSEKLERQYQKIISVDADVVLCKLNKIFEDGLSQKMGSQLKEGFIPVYGDLRGVGTQTILAKKKVFSLVRFDVNMPRLQDLDLLLRLSEHSKIYCMDDALVDYYTQNDSISNRTDKLYQACRRIYEKYDGKPIGVQQVLSQLLSSEAVKLYKSGDRTEYKVCIRKSLRYVRDLKSLFKLMAAILRIFHLRVYSNEINRNTAN